MSEFTLLKDGDELQEWAQSHATELIDSMKSAEAHSTYSLTAADMMGVVNLMAQVDPEVDLIDMGGMRAVPVLTKDQNFVGLIHQGKDGDLLFEVVIHSEAFCTLLGIVSTLRGFDQP